MKKTNTKIFIIEDNPTISNLFKEKISQNIENSTVEIYSSVERALGNVNLKPDYIILDHFLEKSNGIDSIPVLREFLPDAKIIVVTSQNDMAMFENAFLFGANEYFRKDALSVENILEFIQKDIEKTESGWVNSLIEFLKRSDNEMQKAKLIYVLDDNKTASFSIMHVVQSESPNHAFAFDNSKKFFEQVKIQKPDVAILDYNLEEELTGGDVLKEMVKISPKTKIIMFSNQTNVATASELMNNGAHFYLSKSKENLLRLKSIIN